MDRDQRLFVDEALNRVEQLIRTQVWEGVDAGRCLTWYRQFEERECELLGACLLDNLIFRSRRQLESLLKSVLTCQHLVPENAPNDDAFIELLRGNADPLVRLAPVIRLDKSPTKSGTYVLRLLSKSLGIRDKWMRWPQSLGQEPADLQMVVLVDDFCGTGQQFGEFVATTGLDTFMKARPKCRVVYVTGAAHQDGISKIAKDFPAIQVLPGEVLTSEHHFFDGEMLKRSGAQDSNSLLRTQYESICKTTGLGGRLGKYGFQDQGLTYAFAHAMPNNSLPIYWYESERWSSLIDR